MPELFETIALNGDGYENLPDPDVPYYVVAREGYFLHKPTQIGNVLLKEMTQPKTLGRIGYAGGVFTWKGERVPASIISQAHDFFARIFTEHHSEAEVLITMHHETKAFRLFVPYQRVSHMGVKSIHDPAHIDRNYTVVGTLHSHCDFGAFHSGTDTGDASDMDGVHFTIGHVNGDVPDIAAMVMMNGKQFDYKDPTEIADVGYRSTTSPVWWDRFVFSEGNAPTEKPKGMTSLTQQHWDEFLGRALRVPKNVTKWEPTKRLDWGRDWRQTSYPAGGRPIQQPYDWRREVYGAGPLPDADTLPIGGEFNDLSNLITNKRIENALDIAERSGLFTDYDWDETKPADVNSEAYWQGFFNNRLMAAVEVLKLLGVDRTKPPTKQRSFKR